MSGNNGPNKIVYDCMDSSPFYDSTDPYLDEADVIELPNDETSNDFRKYPYG
jgi:hypothetical protein